MVHALNSIVAEKRRAGESRYLTEQDCPFLLPLAEDTILLCGERPVLALLKKRITVNIGLPGKTEAFYLDWPSVFDTLVREIAHHHREALPETYKPYTNLTFNVNRKVLAHADTMTEGTLGAIAVLSANPFYRLILQEFQYGVAPEPGDIVLFDGGSWHGNIVRPNPPDTVTAVVHTKGKP